MIPGSLKKSIIALRDKLLPFPYCKGLEFSRNYNYLMRSQFYDKKELQENQWNKLQGILVHAYQNVPYYTELFRKTGISPLDIRSFDDMIKIPVLTKEDVRKNHEKLKALNWRKFKPALNHTSGSTGEPLNYLIDKKLGSMIAASVYRHYHWCGYQPGDFIAVFRGTLIDNFGKKQKSVFRREGYQIHFSTFEMHHDVLMRYSDILNKYKPGIIRGYPSSLEILADHIITNKIKLIFTPSAIHTSSEVVLPKQREKIQMAFGAPLFDWYGHGESAVNGGECNQHTGIHLSDEFGYTEFVKTSETENIPNTYNIISTSLHNYSMPFIRYDTEDLAYNTNKLCSCKRKLLLVDRIIGRQADIICGVNGIHISPSSVIHYWKYRIADFLDAIKYAQIVQEKKDLLTINIVGKKSYDNENVILNNLRELLGMETQIVFTYLQEIPTGQKWRFTINRIK